MSRFQDGCTDFSLKLRCNHGRSTTGAWCNEVPLLVLRRVIGSCTSGMVCRWSPKTGRFCQALKSAFSATLQVSLSKTNFSPEGSAQSISLATASRHREVYRQRIYIGGEGISRVLPANEMVVMLRGCEHSPEGFASMLSRRHVLIEPSRAQACPDDQPSPGYVSHVAFDG